MTDRFADELLGDPEALVADFAKWAKLFGLTKGYAVYVNDSMVRSAHSDWRSTLTAWQTETAVTFLLSNGANKDAEELDRRKAALVDMVSSDFTGAAERNSHIKRFGALLDSLLRFAPISNCCHLSCFDDDLLTRMFKGNVPDFVADETRVRLLERSPDQLICFLYCYDRFFGVQAIRTDLQRHDFAYAPPMTSHFLNNLCHILQSGDFNAKSLYMLFKSFDLFSMDHPRSAHPLA